MLDKHDDHVVSVDNEQDMVTYVYLIQFGKGTENHNLADGKSSGLLVYAARFLGLNSSRIFVFVFPT